MQHKITVDEGVSADSADLGQPIFSPYCTDECGWQGERWYHADEFPNATDPTAAAAQAAEEEGAGHLADVTTDYDDS